MSKKVLLLLAEGFEEIEAISAIDILRRAGIKVTTAALDFKLVTGAQDVLIKSDYLLDELPEGEFDALVLPGGEPGTTNLENDPSLHETAIACVWNVLLSVRFSQEQ